MEQAGWYLCHLAFPVCKSAKPKTYGEKFQYAGAVAKATWVFHHAKLWYQEFKIILLLENIVNILMAKKYFTAITKKILQQTTVWAVSQVSIFIWIFFANNVYLAMKSI